MTAAVFMETSWKIKRHVLLHKTDGVGHFKLTYVIDIYVVDMQRGSVLKYIFQIINYYVMIFTFRRMSDTSVASPSDDFPKLSPYASFEESLSTSSSCSPRLPGHKNNQVSFIVNLGMV